MLSPAQIKTKANKIWASYNIQRSYIMGSNIFPITISLPAFSAKKIQQNFSDIRAWIKNLVDHSKDCLNHGYHIIFKDINHRQLGNQTLPTHIVFNDLCDLLSFIDKKKEYQLFCQTIDTILAEQPELKTWLHHAPENVLRYKEKWTQLLKTCCYMQQNPNPRRFIRELNITGIDTKLIEQHKKILSELFEQILPSQAINLDITQRGAHYFEQRYGFKHDEQLIRFRILEPQASPHDLSIPLSEFRELAPSCRYVFITENKMNGLSFPRTQQSIVIFGLGYGIQSLREITWLKNKEIIYWGDIDTHGFAMLSQLRSYYPQTKSFLMDQTTLETFHHLCTQEPTDKRCTAALKHLQAEEHALYHNLLNNSWGDNVRLEQERINYHYFLEHLTNILLKITENS